MLHSAPLWGIDVNLCMSWPKQHKSTAEQRKVERCRHHTVFIPNEQQTQLLPPRSLTVLRMEPKSILGRCRRLLISASFNVSADTVFNTRSALATEFTASRPLLVRVADSIPLVLALLRLHAGTPLIQDVKRPVLIDCIAAGALLLVLLRLPQQDTRRVVCRSKQKAAEWPLMSNPATRSTH